MERKLSQKMLGAASLVDIEKLCVFEDAGELRVNGTKMVECEGKVYGRSCWLVIELTLSCEGRTFLIRGEH